MKTYDAKAMTLTLTDGSVYTLPKTFKNPGLKTGEKVSIAWDMQGKHKTAQTVTIAKVGHAEVRLMEGGISRLRLSHFGNRTPASVL